MKNSRTKYKRLMEMAHKNNSISTFFFLWSRQLKGVKEKEGKRQDDAHVYYSQAVHESLEFTNQPTTHNNKKYHAISLYNTQTL